MPNIAFPTGTPNITPALDDRLLLSDTSAAGVASDALLSELPISTATQSALDAKAPLASPTFTGTPTLPTGTIGTTQTAGNSTTALATTAFVTTADNLKANLAGTTTFTGSVTCSGVG